MKNNFTSAVNYFKQIAKSVFIFKNLWKEHTTALLHSPQSTDKMPLISEILTSVTKNGRKVLYVNTDHRASSLPDSFAENENLFIFTPEFDSPDDTADYADIVINGIEEAAKTSGIRTFIVDSVTRIAALSFGRNASPAFVMKRLCVLQLRYNLTLLVIAHDSTKSTDRALANLADSIIEPEAPGTTDQQAKSQLISDKQPSKKADIKNNFDIFPSSDLNKRHIQSSLHQRDKRRVLDHIK